MVDIVSSVCILAGFIFFFAIYNLKNCNKKIAIYRTRYYVVFMLRLLTIITATLSLLFKQQSGVVYMMGNITPGWIMSVLLLTELIVFFFISRRMESASNLYLLYELPSKMIHIDGEENNKALGTEQSNKDREKYIEYGFLLENISKVTKYEKIECIIYCIASVIFNVVVQALRNDVCDGLINGITFVLLLSFLTSIVLYTLKIEKNKLLALSLDEC